MPKKGLSKEELKEWFSLNDVIEVAQVFGVSDMRRRAALEEKMSEKQKDILGDAFDAIEEHGVEPSDAYNYAYERMGGKIKSMIRERRKLKKVM
jgi:hypothetical protein